MFTYHRLEAPKHRSIQQHLANPHMYRKGCQVVTQGCESLSLHACTYRTQETHGPVHHLGLGRVQGTGQKHFRLSILTFLRRETELIYIFLINTLLH